MPVQRSATFALAAADAKSFPVGDRVLEGLGNLRQHPALDAPMQQCFGAAVDDPVVDPVGADVFRYAHLVIRADVVDPWTRRSESPAARLIR
jgi:hypothetical protein